MPIVAKQWAVTTSGTFDFNDPANWLFGVVPGVLDAAAFTTAVNDTVTGNANIAALLLNTAGEVIHLTGSYTMSGAQTNEILLTAGNLIIEAGGSVSGPGNIVVNGGNLFVSGTLAGGSASFTNANLTVNPGAIFDVGSDSFSGNNFIYVGAFADLQLLNAIQISGSIYGSGTELFVPGAISGTGSLQVFVGSTELDGSNTYSGGTNLSAGVLAVGNANALGTGALTISGGEFLGTTTEAINNQATISGNITIAASHGQTLTFAPSFLNVNQNTGDTITFGAPGQDGTVVFPGVNGTVANPNTYTILVQAGTLQTGDVNGFPAI